MSNKAVKNLFIYGSIFFFVIFLALTFDTMEKLEKRAPEITEAVNKGKMVWHKYDCIGCHTILGNGSYFAPDLTKTAEKKPKEYLKQYLMDPKALNLKAAMPKLGITTEEAENLIVFLEWISKINTNNWPPKPILDASAGISDKDMTPGNKLYQSFGCSNCHIISGIGGTTGPDLTHVGNKRDRTWLIGHFKDPKAYVPGSVMPAVNAPDADIEQLTEYMLTLKRR